MVNDYERSAPVALAVRLVTFINENNAFNAQKTELENKIAAVSARIADCESGLRALGWDLNEGGTWQRLIEIYGQDIRNALNPPSVGDPEVTLPVGGLQDKRPTTPSIAQLLLGRMSEIKPYGVKATQLREFLKTKFGIDTHPKTVGMTMYRLSQESPPKVHRKGHTWFFGPPEEEQPKDPSDDTPGQFDDLV